MTTLAFKRLHDDARLPTRAHATDAGLDLRTLSPAILAPGETRTVRTGLAVAIAAGFVGLIAGRSSLGALGIDVFAGIVDASYRGEIKVVLHNASDDFLTVGELTDEGPRRAIAQLLVIPIATPEPTWVAELPASDRGAAGFGSTNDRPAIADAKGEVA